jgi:hypothetical protein
MTKSEMVTFKDQSPAYSYTVPSNPDATFDVAHNDDADLQNFFSRPVRIWKGEWGTGTTLDETIDPWSLFFDNKRVENRIANYNLLRCKLHVKVIINGNGFHYGRAMLSYLPLPWEDDFTYDRGLVMQDMIQASQRPKIFLDPTTSQGGDLILPFFWKKNALSIPLREWQQMGILRLRTLQSLKHANGASDKVTISVFAWAEDVHLSMPTSTEPDGLSPQMGKVSGESDEYAKNPLISQTATAVADASGKLTNVPIIGPYMKATEMAAKTTATVAKALGYSKPTTMEDTKIVKPLPAGTFAVCDGVDTCAKLTVDSKQEATIDPRVVGLDGTDELEITSIATRESYLTQFPWGISEAPDSLLFETWVTPCMWDYVMKPGPDEIHFTACGYASAPFTHWRGSMKYRFQVVASNFHKGRIKVVYDPHGFQTDEFNTNYTHILDIAEEKDFTVEVGWGSQEPFLRTVVPGSFIDGKTYVPFDKHFKTNPSPGASAVPLSKANGLLRVYVLNNLTTPNSDVDNDIKVNVFVCAGDDIEFRNPTDVTSAYYYFDVDENSRSYRQNKATMLEPQMGLAAIDETVACGDLESTGEPSKPIQEEVEVKMAAQVPEVDYYSQVFYGESIKSFRTLLKRYNICFMAAVLGNEYPSNTYKWTLTSRLFPYYAGYAPGAIYSVGGGASYNYGEMTLLNYLAPAFTGRRGGIRWKVIYSNPSTFPTNTTFRVDRIEGGVGWTDKKSLIDRDNYNKYLRDNQIDKLSGQSGCAVTYSAVNPVLEWESPFQRRTRFVASKQADLTSYDEEGDGFQLSTTSLTSNNSQTHYDFYCAAAEDFSLHFFTGAPVMYFRTTIPV